MKQFDVIIKISAETPEQCLLLGNLLQNAVNKVDNADLVKLLTKVKQSPAIVKTALKFI